MSGTYENTRSNWKFQRMYLCMYVLSGQHRLVQFVDKIICLLFCLLFMFQRWYNRTQHKKLTCLYYSWTRSCELKDKSNI